MVLYYLSFEDSVSLTSISVRLFLLCLAAIFFHPFLLVLLFSSCIWLSYVGLKSSLLINFYALQHACLQLTSSTTVMGVASHGTVMSFYRPSEWWVFKFLFPFTCGKISNLMVKNKNLEWLCALILYD